jgi:hypothetical protein
MIIGSFAMIMLGAVVIAAIVVIALAVVIAAVVVAALTVVVATIVIAALAVMAAAVMATITATAAAITSVATLAALALRIGGGRGQLGTVERQVVGGDGERQRGRSAQGEPGKSAGTNVWHLFSSIRFHPGIAEVPLATQPRRNRCLGPNENSHSVGATKVAHDPCPGQSDHFRRHG